MSTPSAETMPDGSVCITIDDLVITIGRKAIAEAAVVEEMAAGPSVDSCLDVCKAATSLTELPALVTAFEPWIANATAAAHFCDALDRMFRVPGVYASVPLCAPAIRLLMASMHSFPAADAVLLYKFLLVIQFLARHGDRAMLAVFIENGVTDAIIRSAVDEQEEPHVKILACRTMVKLSESASGSQRQALGRAKDLFLRLKEQGKTDKAELLEAATAALEEFM